LRVRAEPEKKEKQNIGKISPSVSFADSSLIRGSLTNAGIFLHSKSILLQGCFLASYKAEKPRILYPPKCPFSKGICPRSPEAKPLAGPGRAREKKEKQNIGKISPSVSFADSSLIRGSLANAGIFLHSKSILLQGCFLASYKAEKPRILYPPQMPFFKGHLPTESRGEAFGGFGRSPSIINPHLNSECERAVSGSRMRCPGSAARRRG